MENCNISQILEAFNAPINEEQAWAICFQIIKFFNTKSFQFLKLTSSDPQENIISLDTIFLAADGNIVSIFKKDLSETTLTNLSEKVVLKSLGLTIFQALDYGLNNSEEQKLSDRLENLIGAMTGGLEGKNGSMEGVGGDIGDEGIEDDEDKTDIAFKDVLEECHKHLQGEDGAGEGGEVEGGVEEIGMHCKAVCRALFHEASELSTFLEKMTSDKELCPISTEEQGQQLCTLERKDWARLWMQVMNELRKGVKLKKVQLLSWGQEGGRGQLAFELTPYEILMDDVRSKKYKLHKPSPETPGDSYPVKVKKDVHEIILEFIRSRPPLQPVGRRGRGPEEEEDSRLEPREQLLKAIRTNQPCLRPTPRMNRPSSASPFSSSLSSTHSSSSPHLLEQPTKRVIKPHPNLISFKTLNDDDDDENDDKDDSSDYSDDDSKEPKSKVKVSEGPLLTPLSPLSTHETPLHLPWQNTEKQTSSFFFSKPGDQQRLPPTPPPSTSSLPPSSSSSSPSPSYYNHPPCYNKNVEMALADSEKIKSIPPSTNCLSLTIEEIMHIRSVLTKAELECLSGQPSLYNLLESGKVCFTCKKVKFSLLFGPWPQKCKFCSRNVCSQCASKMRIPTEHFEHIPVYTLNPCSTPPSRPFEHDSIETICGSAPSSPARIEESPRHSSPETFKEEEEKEEDENEIFEGVFERLSSKLPTISSLQQTRRKMLRKSDTVTIPCNNCNVHNNTLLLPGGPLMTVCCECRSMVVSIVRASRRCLAMMQRKDSLARNERAYSACPSFRNNFLLSTPHSKAIPRPDAPA